MASVLSAIKNIFCNSVKIDLLILVVVLYAAIFIITLIALIPVFIIAFLSVIFAGAAPMFFPLFLVFTIAFVLMFILFVLGVSALKNAILIKGARHALKGKKFKIMQLFNEVKSKWLTLLGLQVFFIIVFGILFVLLSIPAILVGLSYIKNPPFSSIELLPLALAIKQENFAPIILFFVEKFWGLIILVAGTFLFFELISFLLSPFTILMYPMVVFENNSIMGAIKNAIALGKKNYFFNLKILFIFFLLNLILGLFIFAVYFFLQISIKGISTVFTLFIQLVIALAMAKIYLANKGI